jgi:hypothetical protein
LTENKKSRKTLLYNLLFLAVGGGVLLFLLNAPPESTKKLPHDLNHQRFHQMDKKAAEKFCEECHNPQGEAPLPDGHPPKYRCLFCHKQDR